MKKKLLCLLLVFSLLAGAFLLPAEAAGIKYMVTAASANVLPQPSAEVLAIGSLPRGTVVEITETSGSFGYCTMRSNGLAGWIYMPLLTYRGSGAENTDRIDRIYIQTLPEKTWYIEGEEEFSTEGLTVYAAYQDGKPDAPIRGYRVYAPALEGLGEKTVAVSYTAPGGAVFSTQFTVTVTGVPLEQLVLLSPPEKTEYIEGEALELAGLAVELRFTDGRPAETYAADALLAAKDFIVTGCHNETQGKRLVFGSHTVNIYYKYASIHCSFTLEVSRRRLTDFWIETPPASTTVYTNTETPDLTGLTMKALYDNGLEETVLPGACAVICDPASFVLGEGNPVTLRYGDKEVTLYFTFALDDAAGLKILTPMVMNFTLGEVIDLTDLRVYLTTASGMDAEVRGYTMSRIDPTLIGPQTVIVRYGEFSGVYQLNITPYYQRGDPNGDGKVTASDARLALRAAVGLVSIGGPIFTAADASRDGKLTAADARLILRDAVGLETLLRFDDLIILNGNGEME